MGLTCCDSGELKVDEMADEHVAEPTEGEHFAMSYEDSEWNRREELACPRCISHYSWTAEEKAVIERVLRFHERVAQYALARWHAIAEQYGSGDWDPLRHAAALLEAVTESPGPYSVSFERIRALSGSLHIALAAGILTSSERKTVQQVNATCDSFHAHLWNDHRRAEGCTIPFDERGQLYTPVYWGRIGLDEAWSWAPRLEGKSDEQIEQVFRDDLDGLLSTMKEEIATGHGGRRRREAVLEKGIWNAIDVIEQMSEDWIGRVKDTGSCAELFSIAESVHEQVFVIDELFSMGCWSHLPQERRNVRHFIEALQKIYALIDWSACPALGKWLEDAGEDVGARTDVPDDLDIGQVTDAGRTCD